MISAISAIFVCVRREDRKHTSLFYWGFIGTSQFPCSQPTGIKAADVLTSVLYICLRWPPINPATLSTAPMSSRWLPPLIYLFCSWYLEQERKIRLRSKCEVTESKWSRKNWEVCWPRVCCVLKLSLPKQNLPLYIALGIPPYTCFLEPLLAILFLTQETHELVFLVTKLQILAKLHHTDFQRGSTHSIFWEKQNSPLNFINQCNCF